MVRRFNGRRDDGFLELLGEQKMKIMELDELVKTVCPIHGLSSDGTIWFKPEATPAQKAAAQALMDEHLASVEMEAL